MLSAGSYWECVQFGNTPLASRSSRTFVMHVHPAITAIIQTPDQQFRRASVSRKILLVDDEPAALDGYQRILRRDFEVVTAIGGEEALTLIRTDGPFAVVISDMKMPGMDGMEFLKHVRRLAPSTIRLMLTGHASLNSIVQAVNEGYIFQFLLKPCEPSVFINAINMALAQHDERKEERVRIELPVRVYRTTSTLKRQWVRTLDISNSGARLAGLAEPLQPGEILKLECGNRMAEFRVVWSGAPGTDRAGQAGLECLTPGENVWALDLGDMKDGEQLARARLVQSRLLPQEKPSLQTLDYAGTCIQARTVGGDYYDFLDLGPGQVGFVLADIAGKGIAAALLMANLHGIIHSNNNHTSKDFPQLLAAVNHHLYKHTPKDRYATFFLAAYADNTRTLHYVNCGHHAPLVLRNTGAVERLSATATVLGLFPQWECQVAETGLLPGDVMAIFSDGVIETTGQGAEEFGPTRVVEVLQKNRDLQAASLLQKMENALQQFRAGEQEDDLTLLIARAR